MRAMMTAGGQRRAKQKPGLWITAELQPWLLFRVEFQRQLGSQISMFHVCWEIGRPVSTGNSQAKLVTTKAT